jgi:hypothetical protein
VEGAAELTEAMKRTGAGAPSVSSSGKTAMIEGRAGLRSIGAAAIARVAARGALPRWMYMSSWRCKRTKERGKQGSSTTLELFQLPLMPMAAVTGHARRRVPWRWVSLHRRPLRQDGNHAQAAQCSCTPLLRMAQSSTRSARQALTLRRDSLCQHLRLLQSIGLSYQSQHNRWAKHRSSKTAGLQT